MRALYVPLGLSGWLLLAAASLRFDVIYVEPKNGLPYTERRIAWPWEGDAAEFALTIEGKYQLDRYGFFGLYGQGRQRFGWRVGEKSYSSEVH
jgi:hypothetical protein